MVQLHQINLPRMNEAQKGNSRQKSKNA